mmetsp:Transcript_25644/g.37495  ORF Transcript_25644/g.37495 Transcript_25644/m.37495 type:complete len:212 (+) Transcript_25644:339-974(+)
MRMRKDSFVFSKFLRYAVCFRSLDRSLSISAAISSFTGSLVVAGCCCCCSCSSRDTSTSNWDARLFQDRHSCFCKVIWFSCNTTCLSNESARRFQSCALGSCCSKSDARRFALLHVPSRKEILNLASASSDSSSDDDEVASVGALVDMMPNLSLYVSLVSAPVELMVALLSFLRGGDDSLMSFDTIILAAAFFFLGVVDASFGNDGSRTLV